MNNGLMMMMATTMVMIIADGVRNPIYPTPWKYIVSRGQVYITPVSPSIKGHRLTPLT